MQQNTWKISEIRDGESVEVATGASRDEALRAIRVAMYGETDVLGTAWTDSVHELPLAA
jgi:hypothetical protein